jgi:hypothetical protein
VAVGLDHRGTRDHAEFSTLRTIWDKFDTTTGRKASQATKESATVPAAAPPIFSF